jgi:hypothetical protein
MGASGGSERETRGRQLAASLGGSMDTTTLLLIIIIVVVLFGGGWYGRGRWF